MNIDVIDFSKLLFLRPKHFFKKVFNTSDQPAYFPIALIIFGLGYGIDRLDTSLKHNGYTDNWITYWCIAAIGGFLGGYLLYLIGGWFYNVRVKWSSGTSDIYTSRDLFLYSGIVSSTPSIAVTLVSFLFKSQPSNTISIYYSLATILFLMSFQIYSICVSFFGVTTITDVDYKKARIWFLIIPITIYSLAYLQALWPYFKYFWR